MTINPEAYVNSLFILMITSIFTYTFIIYKLQKEGYKLASFNYFLAYFILTVIGWAGLWFIQSGFAEMNLTWSAISYPLSTFLLLQALADRIHNKWFLRINITLHILIIASSLLFQSLREQMLFISVYVFLAYPAVMYLTFQRAFQDRNIGYGIIGFAATVVVILAPIQVYLIQVHNEVNTAFETGLIAASTGFVLVGIGLLTAMIVNEHKNLIALTLKDPLTGLYNRRGLMHSLEVTLASTQRTKDCISVIAIDIDHFKKINDTYGHDGGDFVLVEFARSVSQHARSADVCCRLGGEEFLLVLPSTTQDKALMIAERIRQLIEQQELAYGKHVIKFTSSFGIASQCVDIDFDYLIYNADNALYRAKQEGRNRVCCAESG